MAADPTRADRTPTARARQRRFTSSIPKPVRKHLRAHGQDEDKAEAEENFVRRHGSYAFLHHPPHESHPFGVRLGRAGRERGGVAPLDEHRLGDARDRGGNGSGGRGDAAPRVIALCQIWPRA